MHNTAHRQQWLTSFKAARCASWITSFRGEKLNSRFDFSILSTILPLVAWNIPLPIFSSNKLAFFCNKKRFIFWLQIHFDDFSRPKNSKCRHFPYFKFEKGNSQWNFVFSFHYRLWLKWTALLYHCRVCVDKWFWIPHRQVLVCLKTVRKVNKYTSIILSLSV